MSDKKQVSCSAEITLKVIQGRWKLLLLAELRKGHNRFGSLRRALTGISEKVLTQHLREMERDGLIYKKIYPEVPVRVEYFLTPASNSLQGIIAAMDRWGSKYGPRENITKR